MRLKQIAALVGVVLALAFLVLLWRWLSTFSVEIVAALVILAMIAWPGWVAFGFYLGKVEVRGILQGLDMGMEKFFHFKDEHNRRAPAPVQPTINVMTPPHYPQITHRTESQDGEWTEL